MDYSDELKRLDMEIRQARHNIADMVAVAQDGGRLESDEAAARNELARRQDDLNRLKEERQALLNKIHRSQKLRMILIVIMLLIMLVLGVGIFLGRGDKADSTTASSGGPPRAVVGATPTRPPSPDTMSSLAA